MVNEILSSSREFERFRGIERMEHLRLEGGPQLCMEGNSLRRVDEGELCLDGGLEEKRRGG